MANLEVLNTAVKNVFEERAKFVIFGLTGRTGSGCTTVTKLLKQSHEQFAPPTPINEKASETDREYNICYDFIKNNWNEFHVISGADIISSFAIEKEFDIFLKEYSSIVNIEQQAINAKFNDDYIILYSSLADEWKRICETVSKNKTQALLDEVYIFCFKKLPEFTQETKRVFNQYKQGSYTKFYQKLANNIRRSGSAYSSQFSAEAIYCLARRMNSFIKTLRTRQKNSGGKVLVCIDAIRNSFEATFFRERYAAFYLVSVSTDENERRRRLRSNGYDDAAIDQIDEKECPKKLIGGEYYYSQNVSKCVEIADIHLYNKYDMDGAFRELKKQLVRYISLVVHPGIVQPSDVERCMQIAIDAKLNSACLSRQVGAVVTDSSYSIKAIGWNNTPEGQIPCGHRLANDYLTYEDLSAFSEFERTDQNFRKQVHSIYKQDLGCVKSDGWPVSYCFKDIKNCLDGEKNQVHTRALHAEENAFLQITKYGGQGVKGGYLFTTSSPCELCAKKAYQLGITNIYYLDPYPGISGTHVLGVGEIPPKVIPFNGAVGRGYHQLYDPVMPHKEALNHLLGLTMPNKKAEMKSRIKELEDERERLIQENTSLRSALKQQD